MRSLICQDDFYVSRAIYLDRLNISLAELEATDMPHTFQSNKLSVLIAEVSSQSAPGPGNVQILQSNVMSNAVAFTVDSLQITAISPTSGPVATTVTFSGTGFGASQGSSTVWIGGAQGQVQSWSDNTIVANVVGTISGPAYVSQDGVSSNGKHFTVTSSGGGGGMTLAPDIINMAVSDTHVIQALNSSSQSVSGLTWISSNSNIVSLSSTDPPTLTALAAGNVTITAGTASAKVTVFSSTPPIGTVLWSNPGDGSGVSKIVPAVPSSSGAADVFAFQNDGTVQAITSDGTTAWTANVSQSYGNVVPDFQGGLVAQVWNNGYTGSPSSIVKFDGITGQPYPAYTAPAPTAPYVTSGLSALPLVVHPDGTIFTLRTENNEEQDASTLAGIDPTTGKEKFGVPVPFADNLFSMIIAGDGYAYLPHGRWVCEPSGGKCISYLWLLRVDTSGNYDNIQVTTWAGLVGPGLSVSVITNADQGGLVTWEDNRPIDLQHNPSYASLAR